MSISPENSPLIGKYLLQVKIGKKWVQCTNTGTQLEILIERTNKQKAAPDCTFRIMEITAFGLKEMKA